MTLFCTLSNDLDNVRADLDDVLNDLLISRDKWHGTLSVTRNAYNKIFENIQLKANTPYRVEFNFPNTLTGTSYGSIRKTDGSGNYKAVTLTNKTSGIIEYIPDDDITADISVLIQPNGIYTFDCTWRDASPTFVEQTTADTTELKSFVSNVQAYEQSGNLFDAKIDVLSGRYYYRNDGQLKNGANANYAGFIVPVFPNQNYIFTKSNIILLDKDKNPVISSGGNYDFAGTQICNSGLATYFAVTYLLTDVPEDGYVMSMGNAIDYGEYTLNVYAKSKKAKLQKTYERFAGMLESGGSFNVSGKSGIRDGYKIVFIGTFEQFNELKIDFVTTSVVNYVRITASQIIVHNNTNNTVTESHELTISNDVCVLFEMKNGTMYLSVTSMGVTYEYNCEWEWLGSSPSECHVTATDMSFSQASMIVFYPSDRGIWYFGDSYAAFNTNARIPYYIIKYGFEKDILFNTISGSSSTAAVNTLKYLLRYGIPKYIVFATGMNDGSDADNNTPNSAWLTAVQTFINICQDYNIIPILCTVPTIHTVNNNAKNSWVRTSGYRYIEYAGAVGADANGDWYDGMIGIDGIHPSALGANAQFCQLIADMPEIMK